MSKNTDTDAPRYTDEGTSKSSDICETKVLLLPNLLAKLRVQYEHSFEVEKQLREDEKQWKMEETRSREAQAWSVTSDGMKSVAARKSDVRPRSYADIVHESADISAPKYSSTSAPKISDRFTTKPFVDLVPTLPGRTQRAKVKSQPRALRKKTRCKDVVLEVDDELQEDDHSLKLPQRFTGKGLGNEELVHKALSRGASQCATILIQKNCGFLFPQRPSDESYFHHAAKQGLCSVMHLLLSLNPSYAQEEWVKKGQIPPKLEKKMAFMSWLSGYQIKHHQLLCKDCKENKFCKDHEESLCAVKSTELQATPKEANGELQHKKFEVWADFIRTED